jgi:hypothetical protein
MSVLHFSPSAVFRVSRDAAGRCGECGRQATRKAKCSYIKGGSKKKHGEVSSPTQVRYDIVIFIGPVFIISTLPFLPQGACHFKKVLDKQTVVHFLTQLLTATARVLLPICT